MLDSSKHPHRVRLTGIDAPEKAQPFGQRSKEHLSGLVFGKQVEVAVGKTDKYGRTVGKVIVNGVDANLAQVRPTADSTELVASTLAGLRRIYRKGYRYAKAGGGG